MLNNKLRNSAYIPERKHIGKSCDIRSPQNIETFDVRNIIRTSTLVLSDMLSILLGWLVGNNVYILLFSSGNADHGLNLLFPSLLGVSLSLLIACQGYARGIRSRKYTSVFKAITLSYLALSPICAELFSENPILLLFTAWLATIITINGFRWLIFRVLLYLRQQFSPLKIKVMLIGEQEDVRKCLYLLEKSQEFKINSQLNLSQFADTEEAAAQFEQIDLQKVDEILICSWEKIKDSRKFLWKLRCSGTYWRILQLEEQVELDNLEISHFEGVTALRFIESSIRGIDFLTKRIADIAISFVLLVIFGLPMLIIAFLIRIDSPGDIFYRQTRVGLSGNHFKVWKFRTMVQNASQLQQQLEAKNEVDGGVLFKIKDDPRITKIGRILRKYSLDELPQIFNVLRGEMSLVGPRPLPIRDVAKFAPEHFFRHEVLPGITGLWQVSGRSDTDSQNLFSLDLEYIENWSLSLDFKILLRTVEVVLKSKGAY